ncbi:MAG TPA: AMP-binding protein, partial [Acidimicrobiales bacterium]|nr:AMP-binding protein [Acidimicrobiales bacterium]
MRSYSSGPSSFALRGETIGECLAGTAGTMPEALALVSCHQGARLSWAELHAAVKEAARAFLALGVAKGERIGIWSPSRVEWILTQLAAAEVGAILVNVNPAYRPSELAYALRQSAARFLVTAPRFRAAEYLDMLAEVRSELTDLDKVVVLDDEATGVPGDMGWSAFLAGASTVSAGALAERGEALEAEDAINIQYTSGTTGNPKGATLSHHNILNNGACVADVLGYSSADRICVPVPMYHCFGSVGGTMASLTSGAAMVLPAEAFEPNATLDAIATESCTSVYGVPTMFIAMLESPRFSEFDLSSLRTGIMAGAPCPVEVMKRVVNEMHAKEITIAYGMTETSPVSTMTRRSDDLDRRTSTVGTVFPHVEMKVVDPETGSTVPVG